MPDIRSVDQQSRWPLEISDHSLMTGGFSDEDSEAPFAEYLRALHTMRPPDLIVSFGRAAVAFVQRHRHDLFAATPMVFTECARFVTPRQTINPAMSTARFISISLVGHASSHCSVPAHAGTRCHKACAIS
jgi:hypothetical protein